MKKNGGKYRKEIIDFIDKHWREKHFSPSIAELRKVCGINSSSYIQDTLEVLKDEGLIDFQFSVHRSIVPNWVAELLEQSWVL